MYCEYYDNYDLERCHDVEKKAISNEISIEKLDNLLNGILAYSINFFKKFVMN